VTGGRIAAPPEGPLWRCFESQQGILASSERIYEQPHSNDRRLRTQAKQMLQRTVAVARAKRSIWHSLLNTDTFGRR
jgi:hypothetical protein